MPNPKSGGDSANPKRRAGANPKRRAGAGDDPDPKRRASASAGDDPDPKRRAGAGDDPDPERRAGAGDDPDPKRRASAGDDPDPESRAGAGDDPDPDPERRAGAGDDPDPERRAGDDRQPKRRRGDAPDGTNPKRFPEGGDPFGKRTATAFGGVAEGRSTEGEVEKVYPQKEVAMDITERKQQIETICLQMQETASFLTKIKASQTALEREDISNHISVLCDNLSKFRTLLVEIGFDAHESATKHVNDLMATYADHMQETISKNEKIRIRNKGQLIPFQEPGEYMQEYYRLRPHQEEEEETKLTRYLKKQIASEESLYSNYRNGRKGLLAGCTFEAKSMISPMHFTHCTPGVAIEDNLAATTGTSLQIFSFKIDKIKGNLNWPLYVYGVVAARDKVDFNRNILFNRMRNNAQKVTEADPILRLTGPARAILPELHFEVELMVKGRTKSRDRALINLAYPYTLCCAGLHTINIQNCLCEIKLSLEHLVNSVQATIIGVRIVKAGPCTFKYGCRVACSSKHHEVSITDNKGSVESVTDPPDTQVVLLDSHYCDGGEMPMGNDGYLDLTRRVVSVELQANHVYYPEKFEETFKVLIEAYSESGGVAAQGHVMLTPKLCNISQAVCDIGDSQVEITVAWSVHVVSKSLL